MPAERFYTPAPLHGTLELEGTEFHHLVHVMRIRLGETIELVDGRGSLATARVDALTKKGATLSILTSTHTPVPPPRLVLAIPLLRPSKLELILEKCTELGADSFWLYTADHSDKGQLTEHQLERLQHIAISAMKQCGRLDLPSLEIYPKVEALFGKEFTYFFGNTNPQAPKMKPVERAVFITGPERGFSEKEIQFLEKHAKGVSLHKNILRAETAPLVALLRSE